MDSLDQKAALIIPALGTIGVISAPLKAAGQASIGTQVCLALALSASVMAFFWAAATLRAIRYWGGADPDLLVDALNEGEVEFNEMLAASLADAVNSACAAAAEKARRFNLGLFSSAIAVAAFVSARVLEG
jgi:hypothetical protein